MGTKRIARARHLAPVLLPALVAALPLLAEAVSAIVARGQIWLWGDQALIDIEARNTLLGRNLLGVYDRYGWHHLGPMWLAMLGVARWVGGGSTISLVTGFYLVQAAAAAAIVIVAWRLRPGLTSWVAAVLVVGFEWSFGVDRLGTVWAPYAVALPAALLVLLVADVAVNRQPWPATVGAAICASFLCQTEISTLLMALSVLVVAPVLRFGAHLLRDRDESRTGAAKWAPARWGWFSTKWRAGAAALGGAMAVVWAPTVVQQLSGGHGNLAAVYDFFTTHAGQHSLGTSLKALSTVLGSFPFRTGALDGNHDSDPAWLLKGGTFGVPWYVLYLALAAAVVVLAVVRRQRLPFSLAGASLAGLLAMGLSVHLVYGQLYPYLIFWAGAILVPLWLAVWIVLAPSLARALSKSTSAIAARARAPFRQMKLALPAGAGVIACLAAAAFVLGPVPMTGKSSHFGERSWRAVAASVRAPGIRTVYVDIGDAGAMPDGAAIADQVVRHGLHVELDAAALRFADASLAPVATPQLEVVVCCGKHAPGPVLDGMTWRAEVGGQEIYAGRWVTTVRQQRRVRTPHQAGRHWPPGRLERGRREV